MPTTHGPPHMICGMGALCLCIYMKCARTLICALNNTYARKATQRASRPGEPFKPPSRACMHHTALLARHFPALNRCKFAEIDCIVMYDV